MRERWKRGSNSVGFIEKLYRWVQTLLTHYLAGKWQWSGNAEFETRWLTGQDWHGEQENRNPVWPLPNLFVNVYIYICCRIVASSSVSCHQGALWHHSASIYCIFSTFGYSSLFHLCIKNLSLLALSRNDRIGFFVLFFRDSHLSISSLFRVTTGKVFLTISIIVVSTVLWLLPCSSSLLYQHLLF